jgi:energy-coupling factor transport system permease protein
MHVTIEHREGWLHKINPAFKLLTIIFLFIFAITIHDVNFMISFTIVSLILYLFFTGQPFRRTLLFSLPFLFLFISTSSSMILFGKGESTLFKWAFIHISEESLFRGIHLGFRALLYAMLGLTFALTTRPVFLFYSLMQQLKLKPQYAYTFMAAVRLVPIMLEELRTIRYAQKVRGRKPLKTFKDYLAMFISISIPLLSQSIRRAFRIAVAMEAKRFNRSVKRTYFYEIGFSKYDAFFAGYFILFITLAYFFAKEFPFFPVADVRNFD